MEQETGRLELNKCSLETGSVGVGERVEQGRMETNSANRINMMLDAGGESQGY